MKKLKLMLLICALSCSTSCQTLRNTALEIADEEIQNVETAREISVRLLEVWQFQSGFIKGILGTRIDELPQQTVDAINELDALADKDDVTDGELGMSLGLRIRMICETVKQIIKQYYPNIDLLPILL